MALLGLTATFLTPGALAASVYDTFNALTATKVEAQRAAKMRVAQAADLLPQRAARIETAALAELRQFAGKVPGLLKAPEYQAGLKRLADAMAALDTAFQQPISRESTALVARTSDAVTVAAEELLASYRRTAPPVGKLVQLAAKAQYLSQRIARNHLIVRLQVKTERNLADQLKQDRSELTAALNELGESPLNTKLLQQNHPMIVAQWTLMNSSLNNSSTQSAALEDVVKASERMFEMLEDTVLEIERVLKALI
jgi:hypothetical protein